MRINTITALLIVAVGLILVIAGSRGTYRAAWQSFTKPASKTPAGVVG